MFCFERKNTTFLPFLKNKGQFRVDIFDIIYNLVSTKESSRSIQAFRSPYLSHVAHLAVAHRVQPVYLALIDW